MENVFLYKSLCKIDDLSKDQRRYLFEQTRILKDAILTGKKEITDKYRINNDDTGIYEVFLEDSTRTKESFRNAAKFHRTKVSELLTQSSSFNKGESYSDTFNMLVGYSNSIFVVRSKSEGLCKHLQRESEAFCNRNDLPYKAAFINAGDGKHEHPTQELLDEFTFLEDNNYDFKNIHIALVGDLYHGRTVHSKAIGLTVFDNVTIDLVAPNELSMPKHYLDIMKENGFKIREFNSIEEYLESSNIADKWYFTRPQLERMGDKVLKKQTELRKAITFNIENLNKLPSNTKFYHPLPRHKEHPTIPVTLDTTFVNGWERQAINGMYVRMVLLSLISGTIGNDFKGKANFDEFVDEDYIIEVTARKKNKKYSEGVNPIKDGIVIDHIGKGSTPKEIRYHIVKIMDILNLDDSKGGEWVSSSEDKNIYKGIIFRPNYQALERKQLKRLASIAPGCTLNIIKNGKVLHKYRTKMPPRIYNFKDLACKNDACISHPRQYENVESRFIKNSKNEFICEYCDTPHSFTEIWREEWKK